MMYSAITFMVQDLLGTRPKVAEPARRRVDPFDEPKTATTKAETVNSPKTTTEKGKKARIQPKQIEQVLRLLADGLSCRQVAAKTDVSPMSVWRLSDRAPVARNPAKKYTMADVARFGEILAKWTAQGGTIADAAREFCVSTSTAQKWSIKHFHDLYALSNRNNRKQKSQAMKALRRRKVT